jgi:hypothetical protein
VRTLPIAMIVWIRGFPAGAVRTRDGIRAQYRTCKCVAQKKRLVDAIGQVFRAL